MNIDKIREVKHVYARNKGKKVNKSPNQKAFFTKIMKKLNDKKV